MKLNLISSVIRARKVRQTSKAMLYSSALFGSALLTTFVSPAYADFGDLPG